MLECNAATRKVFEYIKVNSGDITCRDLYTLFGFEAWQVRNAMRSLITDGKVEERFVNENTGMRLFVVEDKL